MRKRKVGSIALAAAMAILGAGGPVMGLPAAAQAASYSYVDLVHMVTDMQRNALLPVAGEKSGEASSYDRGSAYQAATDSYTGWDANGDSNGNCGEVNDSRGHGIVALSLNGPGCITRAWSAAAGSGLIDIYVDGQLLNFNSTAAFANYFQPQGLFAGLNGLCYMTPAKGTNNYVPISFSQSCKIILRDGWGSYYQFDYTLFPASTTVESMPQTFSAAQQAALGELNQRMLDKTGQNPNFVLQSAVNSFTVAPGGSTEVFRADGQGAIGAFRVKVDGTETMTAGQLTDLAQQLTVSMYWDGESSPSVWAPLGDFYGTPCGDRYTSLPMGFLNNGWFYCYFVMPYQAGAKIVIGNDGGTARNITVETDTTALSQPIGNYTRFHAKWTRNGDHRTRSDRWPDYTYLKTQGAGRYVGTCVHVYEKNDVGWWGEGDEKFFVDGEKFPSSFGTGSEDYFGFAWGDATLFSEAFHAQVHQDGGFSGAGDKIADRFHISDSIPFQSGFEGSIEKYLGDEKAEYAITCYWYLSAGGTDPYQPTESLADRTAFFRTVTNKTYEAESMTVASADGTTTVQDMSGVSSCQPWSGQKQLYWSNPQQNGALKLSFTTAMPFNGTVQLQTGKDAGSGIFQAYLDGKAIGSPFDAYNPILAWSGPIALGSASLAAGSHELKLVAVGKNASTSGYSLGVDALCLVTPAGNDGQTVQAQDMETAFVTGGVRSTQDAAAWSHEYGGDNQLLWCWRTASDNQIGVGSELGLYLDTQKDFEGALQMVFTRAGDYGIAQLSLDGAPLGQPVNLYGASVQRSEPHNYLNIKLSAGRHLLTVKIVGKDSRSANYLFGMDSVRFVDKADVSNALTSFQVEGENMQTVNFDSTNGRSCWVQQIMSGVFSGDRQLIWNGPTAPGETLTLQFASDNDFDGTLKVLPCKARDMGIYQFFIDGVPYGDPLDCYDPQVVWGGPVSLGHISLPAGQHQLQIKILGKNASSAGYVLGLDAVRFDAAAPQPGVVEAEDLETKSIDVGQRVNKQMADGYTMLRWSGQGMGNSMELNLNLKKDTDSLSLITVGSCDGGIEQISIDGANVGSPADFYSAAPVRGSIRLQGLGLKAGKHVLKITATGKDSASSGYAFALDRIEYPVSVVSLAITAAPAKTTYQMGQELDLTGLAVTGRYDDGADGPVKDYAVSGYDKTKPGTQTVTVTKDGGSDSFTVTVSAPLTGVTLDKQSAQMKVGDTLTLTASVQPQNTTDDKTVTWQTSDPALATVENGVVTAKAPGTVTITAGAGSYSARCEVTITGAASQPSESSQPDSSSQTASSPAAGTSSKASSAGVSAQNGSSAVPGAGNVDTGVPSGAGFLTAALLAGCAAALPLIKKSRKRRA